MKLIKVINGIYGYRPNGGNAVEPKTCTDPAFFVSDEEAERLVDMKVARYAHPSEETAVAPVQHPESDLLTSDPYEGDVSEEDTDGEEMAGDTVTDYNESMKLDDLKKIAIDAGASKNKIRKMRTKKEVIVAIEAAREKSAGKQENAPVFEAADFV